MGAGSRGNGAVGGRRGGHLGRARWGGGCSTARRSALGCPAGQRRALLPSPITTSTSPQLELTPSPSRSVSTTALPEGPARQTADTVLGVGEKVFDYAAAVSYSNSYFEREHKK